MEVDVSNTFVDFINSTFSTDAVSRIRRNHGLEHATLHVLAQKYPKLSMAGHSNATGFWLLGEVPTEAVREAVDEALERMKGGEGNLAVHPNCGTNFVAAGTVAGIAGAAAMFGVGKRVRDKLERLPLAMSLATLGLILAQPLGRVIQERFTTCGEPGTLEVDRIIPTKRGRIQAHRIITRG